jgi:hypothetical protein
MLRRFQRLVVAVVRAAADGRVGLALCYHRVGDPQGRAGWALVPALGTRLFADQLRHVRARYRLVRAGELAEAIATRRREQRFPLAVTFDDDLAVHAGETARLLRHLDLPATFFLGGNPVRSSGRRSRPRSTPGCPPTTHCCRVPRTRRRTASPK